MTFIELPYVKIHYEEPVVVFNYRHGTILGVPELKEVVAIAENLSKGNPYVTYSDVRSPIDLTDQAKKLLANPGSMPLFRGSALLVTRTLYSYAVNFAMHFSKKTYPVKAFVTEETAMDWLRSLPLDAKTLH